MNDQEKVRVLLPHWIEHNAEHAAEFRRWAEKVRVAGREEVAEEIALASALETLGGPAKHASHHEH